MKSKFILLTLQLLIVPLVILIFKNTPDLSWASLIAGLIFLISSIVSSVYFLNRKQKIALICTMPLLILSSILLLLRLVFWGQSLQQIILFGFPVYYLHQFANYLYILWILGPWIEFVLRNPSRTHLNKN